MSTVVLDTITGKSTATTITIGSTPVVSASANSMTIRGEGSAQTSIQQGLCKSWINMNGDGTIANRDSFNVLVELRIMQQEILLLQLIMILKMQTIPLQVMGVGFMQMKVI